MKKILRWIGIALGVVLLLLAAAYAFRGALVYPRLKRWLTTQLEAQTGLQLSVGGLESDLFTYVLVRDVKTLRRNPRGPVVALDLRFLRADYSPLDLLSGLGTFISRARIEIRGAHADLDLTHPAPPRKDAGPGGVPPVSGPLPQLLIQNAFLSLRTDVFETKALEVEASRTRTGPIVLSIRSDRVRLLPPTVKKRFATFDLQARYSPEYLIVDHLRVDGEPVMDYGRIQFLPDSPRAAVFEAGMRIGGGRLEAKGRIERGKLKFKAEIREASLEKISGLIRSPLPDAAGRLFVSANGEMDPDRPAEVRGLVWLRLEEGRLRGLPVRSLRAEATAGDGNLHVIGLDADLGRNRVALRDVTLPLLSGLPAGSRALAANLEGRFRLTMGDVRTAARAAGWEWPDALPEPEAEASGTLGRGRLRVERLDLSVRTDRGLREQARLEKIDLPLAAVLDGDVNGIMASAGGRFDAEINDVPALLAWLGRPEAAGEVPVHRITLSGGLEPGRVRVASALAETDTGVLRLEGGELLWPADGRDRTDLGVRARLRLRAEEIRPLAALFGLPLSGSLRLTASLSGTVSRPAAAWELDAADLATVGEGPNDVRVRVARVTGKGRFRGPLNAPQLSGDLRIDNTRVRTGPDLPPVVLTSLAATFRGSRVTLANGRGEVGGAPFTLGGTLILRAGGPELDIGLRGENLLLVRNDNLRLRADVEVGASGPLEALTLAGDVRIVDGVFSQPINFLGILRGSGPPAAKQGFQLFALAPPLDRMRFNLHVTSRTPVYIRSNVAAGSVRPDVVLTGTGEVPVIRGAVYINPSQITVPSGILSVASGAVTFPSNAPDQPQIAASASTQAQGYTISVQVSGPLLDPELSYTSVPPLSEQEIVLLVLSGTPPRTQAGGGGLGVQSGVNIALYLGRGLLGQWLGGGAGASFLERVQVEVGRQISQQGAETINAQVLTARNMLWPEDALYLTSERDVYDNYNAGVKLVVDFN